MRDAGVPARVRDKALNKILDEIEGSIHSYSVPKLRPCGGFAQRLSASFAVTSQRGNLIDQVLPSIRPSPELAEGSLVELDLGRLGGLLGL